MSNDVTVLPDGSAFAVVSMPLPKDHWLYAPRGEWDSERDEYAECPRPILTNAQRETVRAAARYAIRGATMCGKEADFDPDALVLNMAYALCGPANAAPAQPSEPAAAPSAQAEPVARVVRDGASVRLEWASVKAAHNAATGPLYAAPPAAQAEQEPVAWLHHYRRIGGGRHYAIAALNEPRLPPDADDGYEWVSAEPLYASPQRAVEPVRQLHSFSSIDCEKLIAATVPGGNICDPQEVADSIRRYLNAWPSARIRQETK